MLKNFAMGQCSDIKSGYGSTAYKFGEHAQLVVGSSAPTYVVVSPIEY